MRQTGSLKQIEFDAWQALRYATKNAESPLRFLTYCTIGLDHCPKARTLVLRAVDTKRRELEFHTDIRSPKWTELDREPNSEVIGFSQPERIQLRLEGRATLFHPGSERNQQSWDLISNWTRQTYCGGPPGDSLAEPPDGALDNTGQQTPPEEPTPEMIGPGRNVFGVVTFQVTSMDWLRLCRQDNRRAMFRYDANGSEPEASWINP